MALADQLGAVDPQGVVTGLIADAAPELAQNGNVDPQSVLNRLIRKGLDQRQQRELGRGMKTQPAPETAPADFSSFGQSKEEIDTTPATDFSQFGQPEGATPPKPKPPAPASDMPGVIEAAGQGLKRGGQKLALSAELLAQGKNADLTTRNPETGTIPVIGGDVPIVEPGMDTAPTPSPPINTNPQPLPKETSAAAAPIQWSDFAHPSKFFPKLAYGTGEGAAAMGGAVAGGALGAVAGGPVGGAAGAGVGAGVVTVAQELGPYYMDALKEMSGDKDKAYDLALKRAATDGAISSAGFAAFGISPFKGVIKNLLFQGTVVQPTIAGGGQVAKNAEEGRSLDEGVADTIPGAVAGTIIPGLGMHYALRAGRGGERPEPGADGGEAASGSMPSAAGPTPGAGPSGTAGGDAGPQPGAGPRPGAGPQADRAGPGGAQQQPPGETPEPFATTMKPRLRKTLEAKAAYYKEYPADVIASWDDAKLKGYVNAKFGFGSRADDDEVLRRYGFSDADVKDMSPEDKKANVDEALRNGVHAGEDAPADGTREAPIDINSAEDVKRAADVVNEDHSHAQGAANNIQRGHARWEGLDITLETGASNVRRGVNPETGEPWEASMGAPYGYWKDFKGADGDKLDVFIGPHIEGNPTVYVLDELDRGTGAFRQHKTFIGMNSPAEAIEAYTKSTGKSREQIGGMRKFATRDEFLGWANGGALREPLSEAGAAAHNKVSNEAGTTTEQSPERQKIPPGAGDPVDLSTVTEDNPARVQWMANRTGSEDRRQFGPQEEIYRRPDGSFDVRENGETVHRGTRAEIEAYLNDPIRAKYRRTVPSFDSAEAKTFGAIDDESVYGPGEHGLEMEVDGRFVPIDQATGRPRENMLDRLAADQTGERDLRGVGPDHPALADQPDHQHRAAIEGALREYGIDPTHVRPADIARAAEIHASEGAPPDQAFPVAVLRGLVEDGHISPDTVKEAVGDEAATELLEGGARSQRGPRAAARGATVGGAPAAAAGDVAQGGVTHGASARPESGEPVVEQEPAGGEAGGIERRQDHAAAGGAESGRGIAADTAGRQRDAETEPGRPDGEGQPDGRPEAARHQDAEAAQGAVTKKAPKTQRPTSLLEFIAMEGGLKPTPELRHMGLNYTSRVMVPGAGWRNLVRTKDGLSPDRLVQKLREGRYLDEPDPNSPDDAAVYTQVHNLIDEELRGRKSYPLGETPPDAHGVAEENEVRAQAIAEAKHKIAEALKALKFSVDHVLPEDLNRAAELYLDHGHDDPLAALERAAIEAEQAEGMVPLENPDYIDFEDLDHAVERNPARETGEAPAEQRAQSEPGQAAENVEAREPALGAGESAGGEPEPVAIERTSAGQQHVLPGAERISDRELAERRASEPLKPKVGQKPPDEGLFGDEHKQSDLIDMAKDRARETGPSDSTDVAPDEVSAAMALAPRPDPLDAALDHLTDQYYDIRMARRLLADATGHEHRYLTLRIEDAVRQIKETATDLDEKFGKDITHKALTDARQRAADDDIAAAMALPAKPEWYYSAVGRAIEGSKQDKAAPNQWLGMLRNSPGVKPEEMQWLGLEDWLRDHKGPVTRDALRDYVRANQIEVKEVDRGEGPPPSALREVDRLEAEAAKAERDYQLAEKAQTDLSRRRRSDQDYTPQEEQVVANARAAFQRLLDANKAATQARRQLKTLSTSTEYNRPDLVLPGGENYRELRLVLPEKDKIVTTPVKVPNGWGDTDGGNVGIERHGDTGADYRHSHWPEPNVLAHVRFNDRFVDGKKTLFLEEVQSDWHQQGKRQGYKQPFPEKEKPAAIEKLHYLEGQLNEMYSRRDTAEYAALKIEADVLREKIIGSAGVPDAPFKTTWPELALKRMIRYAAENGYDKIAWTSGKAQADRYDLSKKISRVRYEQSGTSGFSRIEDIVGNHGGTLAAYDHDGEAVISQYVEADKLADHIGKDAAEKLLAQKPREYRRSGMVFAARELSGLDLKVGGEGMAGFYDKILPATVNKLVKKFDAKVEQAKMAVSTRNQWEIEKQPNGEWTVIDPRNPEDSQIIDVFDSKREAQEFITEQGFELNKPWQIIDATDEGRGQVLGRYASREEAERAAVGEHDNSGINIREAPAGTVSVHTLDITPALRDAALSQGFPLFQARPAAAPVQPSRGLTDAAEQRRLEELARRKPSFTENAKRAEVEKTIVSMLDHMTGGRFSKGLATAQFPNAIVTRHGGYGDVEQAPTAGGEYHPIPDIVRIALGDQTYPNPFKSVMHEGTHLVLDHFATDHEMKLLRSPWQRRRMIEWLAPKMGLSPDEVASMSPYEIEAFVGQEYINDRMRGGVGSGLHNGIRRLFDRVIDFFRRIRDWLRGQGFKRWDDVYEKIATGEMGKRESRRDAGEPSRLVEEILAERRSKTDEPRVAMAVAPRFRQPRSRYPVAETIAGWLEMKNQGKLAAISSAVGVGHINAAEIRVKLQDKFLRWKSAEEAVARETGQSIPEHMQPYLAESLYAGRTGERLEALDEKHIDPLIEDIKKRSLTLEDVDKFLMARHAPERNAKFRRINPSIADPSGMSDADARAFLTNIYNGPKRGDYGAIEKRVRALIDQTRHTLVQGGVLSQEAADAWKAAYKYYVPLRGWAEGQGDEAGNGTGRGFDIRGPESKQALGRRTLADSPLGYAMMQAQQAIVRAEKNRVGQTALRFVQNYPNPEIWKIDKGDIKRVIDKETGLVKEVTTAPNKDTSFGVKVDGVPHYINFQGEYGANLARALNNLGTANMGGIMRFFGILTRTLARLSTSWNPDFMVPNFVRDAGEAFTNLQAQQQKTFVKRFAKHLLPSVGGAFNALRGSVAGGKYANAFKEFDAAGGRIRFFGMENVEDIKANIEKKMRRLDGGIMNSAMVAAQKATTAIEIANGAIENATRLAAFMAARDVGLSSEKAASIARELTVNFNRKGELGTALSSLYMFANASIQGSTRMLTAMGSSSRVRRMAYALAAAAGAFTLYNIGMGGDDDDGVPYYQKIAPWERDSNLILMWPKGMGMDGYYIKLPLPYGYSFFAVIGARMTALALGHEKASKAFPAIGNSVLGAFDPLGKDENMLAQFMPTAVKPGVHLSTNENWTGRPINPQPEPWNKHEPNSTRSFRSTSEFSKNAATDVNSLTGGTKHEPGYIDVSPGTIDYMLGFIGGGLGRFGMNAVNTIWRGYQGQEWDINHTPIVHRFAGKVDDNASRALYFEAREEAKTAHDRLQAYRRDKDSASAQRYQREHQAELGAYSKFEAADKQRKRIAIEIDKIKADTNLPAADRDAKIKVRQKDELRLMAEARKRLDDARKQQDKIGGSPAPSGPLQITIRPNSPSSPP